MLRFYVYPHNSAAPAMTLKVSSMSEWGGLWALYDSNHKLVTVISKNHANVEQIHVKDYAIYLKEVDK